jgi:transcription termination/antitermination protein NusG
MASVNSNSFLAWYALSVRSRAEQLVGKSLGLKGIECFLPSTRCLRRWSDRVKEVQAPLFPGYVFARFDCRERLPILVTPGVIDIVGFGQEYIPVSEMELDTIRRVLESRAKCEPADFLQIGQRVIIQSGPLAGIDGFLIEVKRTRRLVVSVSLLQRSINVELNAEWIVGAPPIWQPVLQGSYGRELVGRS